MHMDVAVVAWVEGQERNVVADVFEGIDACSLVSMAGCPLSKMVQADFGERLDGFARVAPGTGKVERHMRVQRQSDTGRLLNAIVEAACGLATDVVALQ